MIFMPRYFIKTFGCQMNVNDSEILAGILEQNGYRPAAEPASADIILVNTCTIRQKAENKAYTFLYEVNKLKKSNPNIIIGLCGCVAQKESASGGKALLKKLPFVDLVMGPQGIEEFANFLIQLAGRPGATRRPITYFAEPCLPRRAHPTKRAPSPRAYINIMYGCNNYCSYCVVPYVRGREVCRPMKDILAEIRALDKSIYQEVILLGQNVNSWREGVENSTVDAKATIENSTAAHKISQDKGHRGVKTLADLLREVSKIDGVEWISFMTSHPKDLSDEIIDAVAELPKVNKYIHLPIQSGSTKILKAMNRHYTRTDYLKLVKKIYAKIPNCGLTSDIIVGFPGETEKDFEDSLDMVRRANFDSVITAAYSVRPGTAAANLPHQIAPAVKKARLQKIMEVVEEVAYQKNQQLVGKIVDVLVEGEAKGFKVQGSRFKVWKTPGTVRLAGRTRANKIVYFYGPKKLIYQGVPVKITAAKSWVVEGEWLRKSGIAEPKIREQICFNCLLYLCLLRA
jgi:tRNA-2-methylthio-N6-dimethylallyladenosine synthase